MTPAALLDALASRGIRVSRKGDLLSVVPGVALTDAERQWIGRLKPELMGLVSEVVLTPPPRTGPVAVRPPTTPDATASTDGAPRPRPPRRRPAPPRDTRPEQFEFAGDHRGPCARLQWRGHEIVLAEWPGSLFSALRAGVLGPLARDEAQQLMVHNAEHAKGVSNG